MNHIIIAKCLLKIARQMIAGNENYGFYSIEYDSTKRIFTVYFLLKENAVESKAIQNAKACRYEIKALLERHKSIEVTSLENNKKSFCFTIILGEEEQKNASMEHIYRCLVADTGDKEESGSEDNESDRSSSEGEEPQEENEKDERIKIVNDVVSKVCRKFNWDTKK